MKKIYFVTGLIVVLSLLNETTAAAGQQDMMLVLDYLRGMHKSDPHITTESIESVRINNHAINLTTNLAADTTAGKKGSYQIFPWFFLRFRWIIFALLTISAISLLLFYILRQKKTRSMQFIPPTPKNQDEWPARQNDWPDSRPKAQLISMNDAGTSGPDHQPLYFLDQNKVTIGRSPENTIVIPESTVSTFHATIQYINGHFQLKDNYSRNGTFLKYNRLPPNQPVLLKHGDIIRFVTFAFRFLRTDRAPSDATIMMAEILKVDR